MIDYKHSGKKVQLPEDKLLAFSLHTHTIVDSNRWLIAGSGTGGWLLPVREARSRVDMKVVEENKSG